jgi:asparagine synthase (glutamine-hydrolysing)
MTRFASGCLDIPALQVLEVETTGLPSLLRFEDKNSMAFSIEARLPFLDYRLVEIAIALAPRLKIRDGWTKWILRQAMNDVLPPQHRLAAQQDRFRSANGEMLARHFDEMTEKIRGSSPMRRLCDASQLMRQFRGLDRNTQWRLYNPALWEEMFGVDS